MNDIIDVISKWWVKLSLSRRNDMKDIVLIITDKVYLTDYWKNKRYVCWLIGWVKFVMCHVFTSFHTVSNWVVTYRFPH